MYSSSDVYTTRGGCAYPKSVESSFFRPKRLLRKACILLMLAAYGILFRASLSQPRIHEGQEVVLYV